MNIIALLLLAAVLLTGCQTPSTPQPTPTTDPFFQNITGIYATTITVDDATINPNIESGDYLMKLQSDLRWFITDANDPGWVAAQGYYTVTADQIIFKATGGAGSGSCTNIQNTYGWKLDGQSLVFTAVSVDDKCKDEKFFLTVHPLIRQP